MTDYAMYEVRASNMTANYSAGRYIAPSAEDAIAQARRNPRNFLMGLTLRAQKVTS